MVKKRIFILMGVLTLTFASFTGCGGEKKEAEPVKAVEEVKEENEPVITVEEPKDQEQEESSKALLTDEEALTAIRNYCYSNNPDLKDIEKSGEYPVYWETESNDEKEKVILFRSYTGAQIRYHIDQASGETYVTEFVPGITSEEEKTDESFNVRDYLSVGDASSDEGQPLSGTWETGSIGYMGDDDIVQPEYYVQFTDSEIIYGHMKDGGFVPEYSNKICNIEEPEEGIYRIQAEASKGGKYTYQTSEADKDILEYFDTWNEDEFPDKYSGGASLSRSN